MNLNNYKILKNSFWAFIPARGSSKSIKLKNLVDINGTKLISFTINILKKNHDIISKIYCSTENKKIKNFCLKSNIYIDDRKKKLALDSTCINDVIYDFLIKQVIKKKSIPEFIILCEPTSPLLRSIDIQLCCNKIIKHKNLDSVQTVTMVSPNSHAYNQRIVKRNLSSFFFKKERNSMYNKQMKPQFYIHGNLRVFRSASFLKYRNIFGKKSFCIKIPKLFAFDLDDKEDLEIFRIIQKKLSFK